MSRSAAVLAPGNPNPTRPHRVLLKDSQVAATRTERRILVQVILSPTGLTPPRCVHTWAVGTNPESASNCATFWFYGAWGGAAWSRSTHGTRGEQRTVTERADEGLCEVYIALVPGCKMEIPGNIITNVLSNPSVTRAPSEFAMPNVATRNLDATPQNHRTNADSGQARRWARS